MITWSRTIGLCCGLALMLVSATSAEAQLYFETSALLWDRDDDTGLTLITGSGGLSAEDRDFPYESGYRLNGTYGFGDWEIDGSFTRILPWESVTTGQLTNDLVLDETANNAIVVASPPANTLGFVNSLFVASTGGFEASESERLQAGAAYAFLYESDYHDYELNFGNNRFTGPLRVAIGYRHIRLDEMSMLRVNGVFDALDVDDAAVSGDATNDPNDALSHAALSAAGLTLTSGTADGYNAADVGMAPTFLTMDFGGAATNVLNGGQVTVAATAYADDQLLIEGIGKIGLYHNRVEGSVSELYTSGNDDSVYATSLTDSGSVGSFVGGVAIRAVWNLQSWLSLSLGYEATLLTNVALSPNQVEGVGLLAFPTSRYSVVTDRDVFMHGGQLGVSIMW